MASALSLFLYWRQPLSRLRRLSWRIRLGAGPATA